ncbi:MAG: DNA/RNA non-specific endonuclease [Anaerolineae bacterium]
MQQKAPQAPQAASSSPQRATSQSESPTLETGVSPNQATILRLQRLLGNHYLQRTLRGARTGHSYNSDTYGDDRERVSDVTATVKPKTNIKRGATPIPLANLHDPNNPVGAADPRAGYDGGHVIALNLDGEDSVYNIVPMLPGFNRGVWKQMEDEIFSIVARTHEDETLTHYAAYRMVVRVVYSNANSSTPTTFQVSLEANNAPTEDEVYEDDEEASPLHAEVGEGGKAKLLDVGQGKEAKKQKPDEDAVDEPVGSDWMVIKNYTLTQPDDIAVVPPLDDDRAKLVRGEEGFAEERNKVINGEGEELPPDARAYIQQHGHLPISPVLKPGWNAAYPDDPAKRPYENLDILAFSGQLTAPGFGLFTGFSSNQRNLILQANKARNGGVLKSDDPNDPVPGQVLSEQGAENFPEIDHIIPNSLGGSNLFSNARVVSWKLNNREARVKPIHDLIDVNRLGMPTIASPTVSKIAEIGVPALLMRSPEGLTKGQIALKLNEIYNPSRQNALRGLVEMTLQYLIGTGEIETDGERYRVKPQNVQGHEKAPAEL